MIFDTIKTVVDQIASVNSFGHGRRSYANQEKDTYPRIWLYPIDAVKEFAIDKTSDQVSLRPILM